MCIQVLFNCSTSIIGHSYIDLSTGHTLLNTRLAIVNTCYQCFHDQVQINKTYSVIKRDCGHMVLCGLVVVDVIIFHNLLKGRGPRVDP